MCPVQLPFLVLCAEGRARGLHASVVRHNQWEQIFLAQNIYYICTVMCTCLVFISFHFLPKNDDVGRLGSWQPIFKKSRSPKVHCTVEIFGSDIGQYVCWFKKLALHINNLAPCFLVFEIKMFCSSSPKSGFQVWGTHASSSVRTFEWL